MPCRGSRPFDTTPTDPAEATMVPLLLVLLLALLLFGAGFALKALWWVAIVVLVVWLLGFLARGTHSSGRRHRWYRW
ncbi:hypothetical protein GCM10018781_02760 [Kitasatospora indigofera]|uniref:Hydrophobic protein n=2 Tax=Kitasatospora indigofera TaxID=67307 RepID=A0A919FBQ6_9ACTN|nr:hypothetical protein GCM10018781_02760 [Kitasatospora indigofera]